MPKSKERWETQREGKTEISHIPTGGRRKKLQTKIKKSSKLRLINGRNLDGWPLCFRVKRPGPDVTAPLVIILRYRSKLEPFRVKHETGLRKEARLLLKACKKSSSLRFQLSTF